ncbi:DUF420 domain-containing protein [Candidatus Nitronereus thalassa]|uniref:DUF420 domain-containing protein n=1 Tax=Candidatus Nitronereus thalassa TaxID=3020898 RepID=A0ABU3KCJ2_9BACT|nr:DUF420 domain-containing protein [Candidatus Nitronereus thalassa]MDT7044179.1 DUF420 domain-containing protein [Candidatus Nitronereus thalassa]
MAEWLREPGFAGTHATMGADVSQLMATFFTALFILGWWQARNGKGAAHHWLMLGGMIAMLAFFTSYYLFRQLGVLAFEGKEGFGGPQALYDNVFIPILTLHIILVVIGLVMAIYMMVLGFRSQTFIEGQRKLKDTLLQTTWRRVGIVFGGVTAVVLLLFLSRGFSSGFSMGKFSVYLGLLIIVGIVFGVEITIQRIWPNGARRHRVLGRFTMAIYCVLFVTGSITYTMLYILYPGRIG